jgi:nucleotide-binding universal stress UspA family protein
MTTMDERLHETADALPIRAPAGPIRRVLLATDLSDASETATERAIAVAQGLGAALIVVSVIDPVMRRSSGDLRVDQLRRIQEARVADLVERARRRRIQTEFMMWTGEAGESIVDAAAAERADLVVVGSRGRGSLGRAILGSVSDHVVRHAPCPVMVVRSASDSTGSQPGPRRA